MFNFTNLLKMIVAIYIICGRINACDFDIVQETKGKFCPTLNNKGDHLPNLGPTQEAFYKYCKELDNSKNIKQPIVAIFGGAYGLRAIEVLKKTKSVTVVLNDLDARHFEGITQWLCGTKFGKRLILVPGSLFTIHEHASVLKYYNGSPIKFHAILMANVFHQLTPLEGIQSLRYISDHLVDHGEAFLMAVQLKIYLYDDCEHYVANEIEAMNKKFKLGLGQIALKDFEKRYGKRFEDTFLHEMQYFQRDLLYLFNKAHGISFPGYISDHVSTINPLLLKLDNLSCGDKIRQRYFMSSSDEMKQWSSVVGLDCLNVRYFWIPEFEPTLIISSDSSPEQARYYFVHLKKSSSVQQDPYRKLLKQAAGIDEKLAALHAGKEFVKADNPSRFVIKDTNLGKQFPDSLEDEKEKRDCLTARMFAGDLDVLFPLGRLYEKYNQLQYAKDFFNFASDMGIAEEDKGLTLSKKTTS